MDTWQKLHQIRPREERDGAMITHPWRALRRFR